MSLYYVEFDLNNNLLKQIHLSIDPSVFPPSMDLVYRVLNFHAKENLADFKKAFGKNPKLTYQNSQKPVRVLVFKAKYKESGEYIFKNCENNGHKMTK